MFEEWHFMLWRVPQPLPKWCTVTKWHSALMNLRATLSKIKRPTPNMNALCRQVLRCYRISCAVSTGIARIVCTITEMRADCLYLAGKGSAGHGWTGIQSEKISPILLGVTVCIWQMTSLLMMPLKFWGTAALCIWSRLSFFNVLQLTDIEDKLVVFTKDFCFRSFQKNKQI